MRLRHVRLLTRDLAGYTRMNRSWWFLGVIVVLALAVLLIAGGQAVAPYAIYPMF